MFKNFFSVHAIEDIIFELAVTELVIIRKMDKLL